jgi:TRAP transporter TAXI family solute receptor
MINVPRPARPFMLVGVVTAAIFSSNVLIQSAGAQSSRSRNTDQSASLTERINANTLAIISGNVNGSYLTIAYDLAAVLNDGDNLRILPVIGHGGGHNIRDVRYLRGIDLGITNAGILENYKRSGILGGGPLDQSITYITKLFNEELHVVVHESSGITSIEQLRGKTINFNDANSNTDIAGRDIFKRLGIEVEGVNIGQGDAVQAMKNGKIAATLAMTAKPMRIWADAKPGDGLRMLPIPFAKSLQDAYLPSSFTSADYPQLVKPGESVEAIAGSGVLIAYNWPKNTDRYRRIEKFVNAFFPKFDEFMKPPRHPKWKEANLTATIPGWTRFPAAQEWLDHNSPQAQQAAMRSQFDQFLAARGASEATRSGANPSAREKLFEEFLAWQMKRGERR